MSDLYIGEGSVGSRNALRGGTSYHKEIRLSCIFFALVSYSSTIFLIIFFNSSENTGSTQYAVI